MRVLPPDAFRARMTLEDATALRGALESPIHEGPTISWGIIQAPGVELFGSPSGREPTTAIAPTSLWPQAFPTTLVALALHVDPSTSYRLRVYLPTLFPEPVRTFEIDKRLADLRVDLEDSNGEGGFTSSDPVAFAFSVESQGLGSFSLTPYVRRRLA